MTAYTIPRYTIGLIKEPTTHFTPTPHYDSSESVYACLKPILANQDREHMYGLFLDAKHALIGINHIAMGNMTEAFIHPREVFKCAILLNAAALILAHNHPSGDPSPSREDRLLTTRLAEAGTLLGIALLDHLIIGEDRYYSFADHGTLMSLG
jgi:DNA repair protein RadC